MTHEEESGGANPAADHPAELPKLGDHAGESAEGDALPDVIGDDELDAYIAQLMEFDSTPVERLRESAAEGASDKAVKLSLDGAAVADAYQDIKLRKGFFVFVLSVVSLTLLASVTLMGFYLWSEWGQVVSEVMIAWFSANVVQVLGLAYIIARYLYPNRPKSASAPEVK